MQFNEPPTNTTISFGHQRFKHVDGVVFNYYYYQCGVQFYFIVENCDKHDFTLITFEGSKAVKPIWLFGRNLCPHCL